MTSFAQSGEQMDLLDLGYDQEVNHRVLLFFFRSTVNLFSGAAVCVVVVVFHSDVYACTDCSYIPWYQV